MLWSFSDRVSQKFSDCMLLHLPASQSQYLYQVQDFKNDWPNARAAFKQIYPYISQIFTVFAEELKLFL